LSCDVVADACVCAGCSIEDVCYADGAANPDNPCQLCTVSASTTDWSNAGAIACGNGTCQAGTCSCDDGFVGGACEACVRYVNGAVADDTGDGTSWAHAKQLVQSGIDAATADGCQVWVAAATYKPTTGSDRAATFRLASGVAVYGGFVGNETQFSARDWTANETILSGDIGTVDDASDNSYHVVTGATGAILDGFTITRGHAADDGALAQTENGAGMINDGASPRVANCTIKGNVADDLGGGVYSINNSNPTFSYCKIIENSARYGGGLNTDHSSPIIDHCVIEGNWASNASNSGGGGMWENTGASSRVSNTTIKGNSSINGAGVEIYQGSTTFANTYFVRNSGSGGYGGGLIVLQGTATISNSVFYMNGSHSGGAIHVYTGSNATIDNSTFYGNYVDWRGPSVVCRDGSITIRNSLMWNNGLYQDNCSGPTLTNNDLCEAAGSNGNVCVDPDYVSTDDSDPTYLRLKSTSACIDQAGADALLTDILGVSATDVESVTNTNGSPRDMGAFEYTP
jgi:hypothetical protein